MHRRSPEVARRFDRPQARAGRTARTTVPLPGPLTISSRPPAASARSCMERRPSRPGKPVFGTKPCPSSMTSRTTVVPSLTTRSVTWAARACLATFCSASWAIRYSACLTSTVVAGSGPRSAIVAQPLASRTGTEADAVQRLLHRVVQLPGEPLAFADRRPLLDAGPASRAVQLVGGRYQPGHQGHRLQQGQLLRDDRTAGAVPHAENAGNAAGAGYRNVQHAPHLPPWQRPRRSRATSAWHKRAPSGSC